MLPAHLFQPGGGRRASTCKEQPRSSAAGALLPGSDAVSIIHLLVPAHGSGAPAPSRAGSIRRRLCAPLPSCSEAPPHAGTPPPPHSSESSLDLPGRPPLRRPDRGTPLLRPAGNFTSAPTALYLLVGCGELLPDHGTDPS